VHAITGLLPSNKNLDKAHFHSTPPQMWKPVILWWKNLFGSLWLTSNKRTCGSWSHLGSSCYSRTQQQ